MVWSMESSGEYIVRSGYRVLQGGDEPNANEEAIYRLYVRSGFSSQQGINGYMINYSSRQNKWWKPPKAPFLKINFDAAFKAHFAKSYLGLVIRDERSRIIGKRVILNEYVSFVFAAKALVCLQALKLGVEVGLRDVVIEGDSLTRKFREVWFTFVSRSTNGSAHALAQKGWIRGESLNLGWRDLMAIVTLEAQDNLVRGVEGEDGVVGL
ncbi:hypothetical protein Gotur_023788 [Gossypium turneri]